MTAREKFRKGDRVRLTARGLAYFRLGASTGVVAGFCPSAPQSVRVLIDGCKWPDSFNESYWEIEELGGKE